MKRAKKPSTARTVGRSGRTGCSALRERLVDIILKLTVHPAGMDDWEWYENLCLECADDIEECVKQLEHMQNPKLTVPRLGVDTVERVVGGKIQEE